MDRLSKISRDYKKYHLNENSILEKWEDGMRTNGAKGSYEWWYFDAHLDDGTTVVIIFFSKQIVDINKSLSPFISVNIDTPGRKKIKKITAYKKEIFSASKESCNVRIGQNYFRGDLENYDIHFEDEDLNITCKINRTSESWRPKTGHIVFGKEENNFFAWVVPIPKGEVNISYSYKDETRDLKGLCYHDHNWGNINLRKIFNHWYWSRANIGEYSIIASEMIAQKAFNNEHIIVFNIAKGGKTLADNEDAVRLYRSHGKMHAKLKKDVSDKLLFIHDDPEDEYRYEYYLFKKHTLMEGDLAKLYEGKGIMNFIGKTLNNSKITYFRFSGTAEIRILKNDQLIEKHSSSNAIWELMYFGKPYK